MRIYKRSEMDLSLCERFIIESGAPGLPDHFFISDNPNPAQGLKETYDALATGLYDTAIWNGLANAITPETSNIWQDITDFQYYNRKHYGQPPAKNIETLTDTFNDAGIDAAQYIEPLITIKNAMEENWGARCRTTYLDFGVLERYYGGPHYDSWSQPKTNDTIAPLRARVRSTLHGRGTIFFERDQLIPPPLHLTSVNKPNFPNFITNRPRMWETKPWAFAMFAGLNTTGIPIPAHSQPLSNIHIDEPLTRGTWQTFIEPKPAPSS